MGMSGVVQLLEGVFSGREMWRIMLGCVDWELDFNWVFGYGWVYWGRGWQVAAGFGMLCLEWCANVGRVGLSGYLMR